jgi:hypothetical protein
MRHKNHQYNINNSYGFKPLFFGFDMFYPGTSTIKWRIEEVKSTYFHIYSAIINFQYSQCSRLDITLNIM